VALNDVLYIDLAEVVGRDMPRPSKRTGNENSCSSKSETSQPNIDGKESVNRVFYRLRVRSDS